MECCGKQQSMDACSEDMWLWRAPQLVLSRHVCMEEHRAADVVQCAKKVFSLAILWRGIWTREA